MSLHFFLRSSEKEEQKRRRSSWRSNIQEQPALTVLLMLINTDEALPSCVFHFLVPISPLGVLANAAALTVSDSRGIDPADEPLLDIITASDAGS